MESRIFSILRSKCIYIMFVCLALSQNAIAANKTVHLIITNKTVNFAGKNKVAITVNDQIPGPTLRFKHGDHVTIKVHNKSKQDTTIHWHGILVPWQMDGVAGVSQTAIAPGQSFNYEFTLMQAGTYWYHAHTGLEEQEGLYGAFIVEPIHQSPYAYDKDFAIVLSDWSNTDANVILDNLQQNGQYYAAQHQMFDYNDVAYDAFLLNGHTKDKPWTQQVAVGDRVRLRFIGAGASTIFRIKIPDVSMQIINVQGNRVKAYYCQDFIVAPGETQDVLLNISERKPYIIYAESMDKVGKVFGALLTDPHQTVNYDNIESFPNPDVTTISDKYKNVIGLTTTNDTNKPIKETININLSGDMQQYKWLINDVPGDVAKPIIFEPGQRYRFIFTNSTMMPHPMHLHGHWFILRNKHGKYDPLLHTIVVAPNETIMADVDADASGQWFFHCHVLYHMMTGMSRVVQYSTLKGIVNGDLQPQNIVEDSIYRNRPIIRVDALLPIDINLVNNPQAK